MLSIKLGPLALPVAPVVLLVTVVVSAWVAGRVATPWTAAKSLHKAAAEAAPAPASTGPHLADAASHSVWLAALAALVAARLVHLVLHAQAYASTPWAALDLRDGGWHTPSAWAAAIGWLLWRAWRTPPLRQALAAAGFSGVALWSGAQLALGLYPLAAPQRMPALALSPLANPGGPGSLVQAAAGRPVVVNLWATWCAPCRQEMPMFAQAQTQHRDIGFLFVNQGESAATVQAYLARERLGLREVWLDAASALGPAVGSAGMPTTLFYNAAGELVDTHVGMLNAAALQTRLQALRP
jgi:thiol-disulfide isomerase/thioredoxin